MDPDTTVKKYWKLVKSVYGSKQTISIPPLIENGSPISSDEDKAELLNEYFTSQTIPPETNVPLPETTYLTDARLDSVNITPHIVRKILKNLNPSKASGPDFISNRVLK